MEEAWFNLNCCSFEFLVKNKVAARKQLRFCYRDMQGMPTRYCFQGYI